MFFRRFLQMAAVPEETSGVTLPVGGGGRQARWRHWFFIGVALVLAGWLYGWLAGVLMGTTNQNPLAQDQKNNMRLALAARSVLDSETSAGGGHAVWQRLPHQTDGVVAPLWPWVAAWVARDGHVIEESTFAEHTPADQEFFARGKWLNVWISGLFLALAGLVVAREWTLGAAVNFVLLSMLGAILPRAVAFQPEPLYFIFFFLSWVVGLKLCERNAVGWYAIFGVCCGLAGLAKSSIQPLMAVWLGVMTVRWAVSFWRPTAEWSRWRHGVGVAVWGAVFLLVMAPRLVHGHERWGRPFFAYPNVWMWMDDFGEGYAWMGAHPDRKSLEATPTREWPSWSTYWATHEPEEVAVRLRNGLIGEAGSVSTFLTPRSSGRRAGTPEKRWKRLLEPRGLYLAGVAGLAVAAAGLGWAGRRHQPSVACPDGRLAIEPGLACQILMVAGTFVAFALLYGWYTPIGRGDRFMLSLWVPLVFTLMAWSERAVQPLRPGRLRWSYHGCQLLLLGFLLWRLADLVRAPFFESKLL